MDSVSIYLHFLVPVPTEAMTLGEKSYGGRLEEESEGGNGVHYNGRYCAKCNDTLAYFIVSV